MGGEGLDMCPTKLGSPWSPIETAPRDGTLVLVYAPAVYGLKSIISVAAWHDDAGWCIDELRVVTHWMRLPDAPKKEVRG